MSRLQNEVGTKDAFPGTNFLTKNALKLSPKFSSLFFGGSNKNPAKFPPNFPQKSPPQSQQKITDELLQERREIIFCCFGKPQTGCVVTGSFRQALATSSSSARQTFVSIVCGFAIARDARQSFRQTLAKRLSKATGLECTCLGFFCCFVLLSAFLRHYLVRGWPTCEGYGGYDFPVFSGLWVSRGRLGDPELDFDLRQRW